MFGFNMLVGLWGIRHLDGMLAEGRNSVGTPGSLNRESGEGSLNLLPAPTGHQG